MIIKSGERKVQAGGKEDEEVDFGFQDIAGVPSAGYPNQGEQYQEHLLKQYELAVASTLTVSEWRHKANRFYWAMVCGVVAGAAWLMTKGLDENKITLGSAIFGALLSWQWVLQLNALKGLNRAKFRVITTMETQLPVRLFDAEWDVLGRAPLRGVHKRLTRVDALVPSLLLAVSVIAAAVAIARMING
jgi:hypothetical protein